jgi:hypothetical protein
LVAGPRQKHKLTQYLIGAGGKDLSYSVSTCLTLRSKSWLVKGFCKYRSCSSGLVERT